MKTQNKKISDCFKYFFNEKENTYIVVHNDEIIYEPEKFYLNLVQLTKNQFFSRYISDKYFLKIVGYVTNNSKEYIQLLRSGAFNIYEEINPLSLNNDENFDGIYEPIYDNYYLQINYSYEDGNDNIVEDFCLKKITKDEFESTFEIPYVSENIKNMKKIRDIKTKRFYKEIFLYFSGLVVSLVLMNYYLIVLFSIIALFGVFFGNLKVWYECSHLYKENLNNIFIKAKRKKEQKFIKGQHVIITGKKVPLYTTIKFIQWNEEHKDWNYYFDNGNGILKFTTDAFIEAI